VKLVDISETKRMKQAVKYKISETGIGVSVTLRRVISLK
jgi:hypothetical protein